MHFPAALSEALDDLGWTQAKLADFVSLPPQQISKYVTGAAIVGGDVIEKIGSALPSKQRAGVIAAYLRDRIPDCGRDLVKISAYVHARPKVSEPSPLPADVREAIEGLAKLARKDSDIERLLVHLYAALS